MFTPLGLDHVVLRVRDQAASQRFYTDALGCTLDHVNEVVRLVQLRFGDQLIEGHAGRETVAVPLEAARRGEHHAHEVPHPRHRMAESVEAAVRLDQR